MTIRTNRIERAQPRAIIPFQGPPVMIAFAAEEPEMREYVGDAEVEIFTHVGEQINDVTRMSPALFATS